MDPATQEPTPAASAAMAAVAQAAPAVKTKAAGQVGGSDPVLVQREEMAELLTTLDQFQPTIPDEVIQYYLRTAGFEPSDPKVLRIVSLATQKFVADVAQDAFQISQQRTSTGKKQQRERHKVLQVQDLSQALNERNINVVKPPYYS
eukprot:m.55226 g.55226  ORF g.55226 m.55226 type:complete len:147 (-) comp11471_c1_seq2:1683-2123(-)